MICKYLSILSLKVRFCAISLKMNIDKRCDLFSKERVNMQMIFERIEDNTLAAVIEPLMLKRDPYVSTNNVHSPLTR